MNSYFDRIRAGETVILQGEVPNRNVIVMLGVTMTLGNLLASGVLYYEMGLFGLMMGGMLLPVTAFFVWRCWRTGCENRDDQVIRIDAAGLFTRGVLLPWQSIALFDVSATAPLFKAELLPGATLKFADSPQEEAMRLEVARLQGLVVHTAGHRHTAAEIAELCKFAIETQKNRPETVIY
ncbi:hypothetical protein WG936_03755 [Corynebacterium sp. H127]|uniref:hypothetical protein n=1 Tax=Corynebacterium sp. H127 TaxID=3133418 RepID=UPI0030A6B422